MLISDQYADQEFLVSETLGNGGNQAERRYACVTAERRPTITAFVSEIAAELKSLRRGWAIESPDLTSRMGPALCAAARIRADEDPARARERIAGVLSTLIDSLPEDLRLACRAAFGLDGALRARFYKERIALVAVQLDRDPRTVQRRVDDGIARIAESLTHESLTQPSAPRCRRAAGAQSRSFQSGCALRRSAVLERIRLSRHTDARSESAGGAAGSA